VRGHLVPAILALKLGMRLKQREAIRCIVKYYLAKHAASRYAESTYFTHMLLSTERESPMKPFALFHGRQSKQEEKKIILTQPEPTPPFAFQELTNEDLEQVHGGTCCLK
jgi:hypothetical protein